MHEYKKVKYWLNCHSNQWQFSLSLDKKLKPLFAKTFEGAKKEVEKIINKL